MPEPRQIILITKNEQAPDSFLGSLEKVSKALAILALPVILGVVGYMVQRNMQKESLGKEYTNLAITILSSSNANPRMLKWGNDVLVRYSPVPFPEAENGNISDVLISSERDRLQAQTNYLEQMHRRTERELARQTEEVNRLKRIIEFESGPRPARVVEP